jgi:carbonic anhydrase/acetyltransferase-like protein (isoleucine patch superfamily)
MAHIITVRGWTPKIDPSAFLAPNATIIGNVTIEAGANIWFGVVLRGDQNEIRIGEKASIQDNTVIHCNEDHATIVGRLVTVGHCAVLEGCTIEDGALIGMNATVLDGATVGAGALVAAGSVVRERDSIPAGFLAAGIPAVAKKKLEGPALAHVKSAAEHYQYLMSLYTHLEKIPVEDRAGRGSA